MKRVGFGVLWTFVLTLVFLILCCVVAGFVSAFTLKGSPAENSSAIDEASAKWALPMFFGSLVAAVGLSACGVLPGTRRRPAIVTGPDVLADSYFPPARPTIVLPIGVPEDPPPQLAALGPPRSVYPPGMLASMSGFTRLATFVMGLVLLIGPAAVVSAAAPGQIPPSLVGPLVIGGFLAGLICLALAFPGTAYTYRVHREALVVSDRKTLRIIPWDQIQALIPYVPLLKDFTVVTRDGQEVPIKGSVRDYHELIYKVFVHVRDRLLPLMIKQAHAGRMVEFGPLGVSGDALRYKGQTVPWEEVTRLMIVTGSGLRHLTVHRRGVLGFWPFIQLNLNTLPNDMLLRELLQHIAPPRLLEPTETRW
ncbi:MAG TPA: DUF6585 family protein [Pirellulaceae bacterium]|nr:DUF6585 family protein [Pirellulaceae bacterium]